MTCPTEDFIEQITGQKLPQIKKLSLVSHGFNLIDVSVLNKMVNLTELDFSRNQLEEIPEELRLPKLRKLDISDNQIKSVLFLRNLPGLEEIHLDGNGLEQGDKHIALTLCPTLTKISKYKLNALLKVVDDMKSRLWPQVQAVWSASLADRYSSGIPSDIIPVVVDDFTQILKKQHFTLQSAFPKYTDFMNGDDLKRYYAEKLVKMVSNGTYESPRKKRRQDTIPGTPGSPRFTVIKRKGLIGSLPPVDDFEPLHFIRCHSGGSKEHVDNDPTDNQTQIWKAAFEPNPHKPGEFTNIVATVGGHNVCLIDCNSGKVMKRYKEINEHFFTIAWTTIQMKQGDQLWPTSILVAAGVGGCVRLLHPDQLVCYHAFEVAGKRRPEYINASIFHPVRKTHLYCGDSDGNITGWDIGIPNGAEYKTTVIPLFTLRSRTSAVVSLVCDKQDHLIAGCEGALLVWNLPENLRTKAREPDVELVLPGTKKDTNVDGLTSIGDDLIATKVTGEGCVYLWRISSVLSGRNKSTIKINPMAVLEWLDTKTMYLNLGANQDGMLACGDDRGQVWLYNVSRLLKTSSIQPDELLRASRILPWPMCETHKKRDLESLMIDLLDTDNVERIINHVAVSQDGEYVVACTADNMVCIWRAYE